VQDAFFGSALAGLPRHQYQHYGPSSQLCQLIFKACNELLFFKQSLQEGKLGKKEAQV
jgi:hypothetical protein